MKPVYAILVAGLAVSGNASADDGFKIETEAQFENDYSGQVEKISPGVYLVVNGPSSGKTVSIGRSGLEYDLSIQRTRVADGILAGAPDHIAAQTIVKLEEALSRYAEFDQLLGNATRQSTPAFHSFTCISRIFGSTSEDTDHSAVWTTTFYHATAYLDAHVEFYIDNGGGGWNHYYARSSASAYGNVWRPFNVPFNRGGLSMTAYAKNRRTGVTAFESGTTAVPVPLSTGYVTNFNWTHTLFAEATAIGYGDCFGYASVSDSEPTY